MEKIVKLLCGNVTLVLPKAKDKNKALLNSEEVVKIDDDIRTITKVHKYTQELLPYCISSHPWGTTPVRQALGELSIPEYDFLAESLSELLILASADIKKKLEMLSVQ